MDALRRVFALVTLLTAEVAAVGLLHRLGALPWLRVGWEDPAAWLAWVPAEDAVMAALRLVALGAAYWLLITTVCYTLARGSRLPAAVRSVEWATLPVVRRVADRAVAVVLTGTTVVVGAPGLAVALVPPPAVSSPADLPGTVPELSGPACSNPAESGPAAPPPVPAADKEAPAASPAGHVVVAGDNLWTITAGVLGGSATDSEIHARWRAVIDANRDRLRSGDPDLIHPGEHLVIPPPEHRDPQ